MLGVWAPPDCSCYLDGCEAVLTPEEWLVEVEMLSWEKPLWQDSRLDNDPLRMKIMKQQISLKKTQNVTIKCCHHSHTNHVKYISYKVRGWYDTDNNLNNNIIFQLKARLFSVSKQMYFSIPSLLENSFNKFSIMNNYEWDFTSLDIAVIEVSATSLWKDNTKTSSPIVHFIQFIYQCILNW